MLAPLGKMYTASTQQCIDLRADQNFAVRGDYSLGLRSEIYTSEPFG